jgi:6-phospho-beta-glucosidase
MFMKVAVIGGGSTYTPELVNGFLERAHEFPLKELWLMDIDPARLDVVGGFAKRMVQAKGSPFKVELTTKQREAIAGASYVITQLRVGGMEARRNDEYLGKRHRLIGQETTGVGGMAKALRTIPVILKIASDVRESAEPDALLVNFTNPAGLVTQALHQYAADIASVGVCNVAITTKMEILDRFEQISGEKINPKRAELITLGLNHLTWHRGFTVNGKDIWQQVMENNISDAKNNPHAEWDPRTLEVLQMLPNYYLQYYYYTDRKLAAQDNWPPSRAEEVMTVEDDLLKEYADSSLKEPPADLMKRGGAYYSTVATQLLNAHYNDLGETHIVNVANNGAVKEWPIDWVLELPAPGPAGAPVGTQGRSSAGRIRRHAGHESRILTQFLEGLIETDTMPYYLGADVGSSKTHILIADENGLVKGFGKAGPGNHQTVGYEGMFKALNEGIRQALLPIGITARDIAGSGFGISGYDWPSDQPNMAKTIARVGLNAPVEMYNDTILGLVAGAKDGWGIAVVSGTGCNCWGWDRERRRIGRVTGFGIMMGEAAGSTDLVYRTMQIISHAWTRRGQATALSRAFVDLVNAKDVEDLLEGYTTDRYQIDGSAAPLVFQAAETGDTVARQLIHWAGNELGEMAKAVIRQLDFQALNFDVVLIGGMFEGGSMLVDPLRASVQELAPHAHLVRLTTPPVIGAVLIGMQAGGLQPTPAIRQALSDSLRAYCQSSTHPKV